MILLWLAAVSAAGVAVILLADKVLRLVERRRQ